MIRYKPGNPMHPAYPTPHQEEYTHTSHLIKTFINKSISEQGIRGQFVPNSTQRRHRSTASHKYLISCLCISITTWAITTLKQPRPLLDRGNSHKHFYKRPKRFFTITPHHEPWFCLLSTSPISKCDKYSHSLSIRAQLLEPFPTGNGFPVLLHCFPFT